MGIDTYGEDEGDLNETAEVERKVGNLACVFYQNHYHKGSVGYRILSENELKAGFSEEFTELDF